MSNVPAIPPGYGSLIPSLVIRGAAQAIDFYKALFGAEEMMRMAHPTTHHVMHAELKINGQVLMLGDEMPEMGAVSPLALGGPSPVTIMLYVPDTDVVHQRALDLGAKSIMPPADMFWGDRFAKIVDPFGHQWAIATHQRDVPPDEMAEAARQFGCG